LRPETGGKGGSNPYQVFTAEHLLAAKIIRTAQSLGMSLKEIAAMSEQRRAGRMSVDRSVEILRAQLARLQAKEAELAVLQAYLRAKIAWLRGGQKGAPPDLDSFSERAPGKLRATARRSPPPAS
jgi:DNA-binding transcriptional MerR regulator